MAEPLHPSWDVPVEFVRHCVSGSGFGLLVKAERNGARFKPTARIFRRVGHFVAQVDFEEPIGPKAQDGQLVTLEPPLQENSDRKAPPAVPYFDSGRWTPQRKLAVLQAIEGGRITLDEAFELYGLAAEEIELMAERHRRFGLVGLATKSKEGNGR